VVLTSNPQILSDLRLIMDFDHQIELMNTYRGVPVICRAKVLSIQDNMVEVEAHDPALVCLARQKQTKILGSDYFEPASARVESVDLINGKAVLSHFTYQSTRLGERMIVRVEPKDPIPVRIENQGQVTIVEMIDLSLNGMGVRVASQSYNVFLKPGTAVQVDIPLPKEEVRLAGNIVTAIKTGNTYRLSVRFLPGNPQRVAVFRYLIDRRAEIAIELKQEYEQALRDTAEAT
jgi:hypothetical protein